MLLILSERRFTSRETSTWGQGQPKILRRLLALGFPTSDPPGMRASMRGWVRSDALPHSLPSGVSALTLFFLLGLSSQLKDPKTSHLLKGLESEEELFLQSKKTQLRSLLAKIEAILQ